MGIIATARTAFRSALATFKATGPTRAQLRRFVAATVDAGNEWLAKFDAQESAAPADFAATKPALYAAHLAALAADPAVDPP